MPVLWVDKRLTYITECFYDLVEMIIISRRWVVLFFFYFSIALVSLFPEIQPRGLRLELKKGFIGLAKNT